MKILAIGDVTGNIGVEHLERELWRFRKENGIGFVIANGENATEIRGLCAKDAKRLWACGVDVITLGNHTYGQRDLYPLLENEKNIIRPANYPPQAPGMGCTVADTPGGRLLCMNVNGRMYMDAYGDPFRAVEQMLERESGRYDFAVLDIHAEATSEKLAIARVFDGRVQIMYGTHTHVATADEQILPGGSAYQTDIGMCGCTEGILGAASDSIIEKFRTLMPARFRVAEGTVRANGTVFTVSGNCVTAVQRVVF